MSGASNHNEPFKVEAIVLMNGEEAFVLNRKPQPIYEFSGRDLIGTDGPFVDYLYYEAPSGRFKAFAGREFHLPMADGTTVFANGQYWQGSLKGAVDTAWGTKDGLKRCYVFCNGAWDADERQKLRDEYKGDVYPYWSYEALLKAPDLRMKAFMAEHRFERAKSHILKNLSTIKAERDALRADLSDAAIAEAYARGVRDAAKACRNTADEYRDNDHDAAAVCLECSLNVIALLPGGQP